MEIQQAAATLQVSPAALRHYEALGLFDGRHVTRNGNGYRWFTGEGLERGRLIVAGRAVGLSLREIADGIERWESGEMSEAERVALFRDHLAALEAKIEEQVRLRDYLRAKLPDARRDDTSAGRAEQQEAHEIDQPVGDHRRGEVTLQLKQQERHGEEGEQQD